MKAKISLIGMLCLINKLLKIKHILALMLVFMCISVQDSLAQIKKPIPIDELPELKIGDTVPEELWNHPMELWTAADGSVKTITLNDYRGKVIILDFWATWCGSCINYFPHMQDIQNQAGEGLVTFPVTYEPSEEVQSFYDGNTSETFGKVRDDFHSIVGQYLDNLFARRTIPHIIVISKSGRIAGVARPEYINHRAVAELLLNKKDVYIPLKRSYFDKSLLTLSPDYSDVKINGPVYYSAVISFTDGLGHANRIQIDSVKGTRTFAISNTYIARHYSSTKLFGPLPLKHNRRILEVNNPRRYIFTREDYVHADWRRKHWYSYEAVFPIGASDEEVGNRMKDDLDLFLGLNGRLEKRKVDCLVYKKLKDYVFPDSLINVEKRKIEYFASVINQDFYDLPFVIDELGEGEWVYPRNIAIHEWKDLDVVRPKLWAYGLDLVPENREIDMFVLTEKGHDSLGTDQLELTSYGYVPKSYPSK